MSPIASSFVKQTLLFIALISMLYACRQPPVSTAGLAAAKANMLQPAEVYASVKKEDVKFIDSVYLTILAAVYDSGKYDLLREHLHYYELIGGKEKDGFIACYKAAAYSVASMFDSSDHYYNLAIVRFKNSGEKLREADCYFGIGVNARLRGDYKAAFKHDLAALERLEKTGDSGYIYKVKNELAVNYEHLNDTTEAIRLIKDCIGYCERQGDSLSLSFCLSVLSNIYQSQGYTARALEYATAVYAIRVRLGAIRTLPESLNNIASIYISVKKWDSALVRLNRSLAIVTGLKETWQIPVLRCNIAMCLWHMGQKNEAEQILLATIDSAASNKEERIVAHGYKLLADFYKEDKHFEKALVYYQLYKQHNDSLFNIEKQRSINELAIKYETGKKEARILALNYEARIARAQKIIYIGILVFTIVSFGLTILTLAGRARKNRLEMERSALELVANARELKNFTESIIAKNKRIEELENKPQFLPPQPMPVPENDERLSRLYQLKILTEDDWLQFKMLFDKVYPAYIARLREKYPELSPSEERQFLLTKLKIDTKECADMLGISAQSVKKNRYRLKKRFNLGENEDLDEFVQKFI